MNRALFLASAPLLIATSSFAAPLAISDQSFFSQIEIVQRLALSQPAVAPLPPLLSKTEIENKVFPLLAGTGVSQSFARAAIEDPQTVVVPEIIDLMSAPAQSVPYQRYRDRFLTSGEISLGAQFYLSHRALLSQVQASYGVDPLILTSLVGVETRSGANTGSYHVISALFTIAAAFPNLSNWACREIVQYLKICADNGMDPQSLLGSYAGAFGYFQFMPSSYNIFAVDFDGDGKKSWDQWPDVLASVSNYLDHAGYKPGPDESPGSPVWKALYSYNHSDNYVQVILEMRKDILAQLGNQAPENS